MSIVKSLITGNPFALHGSITIVSPSLKSNVPVGIESIWGWLNSTIEIKENKSVKILMTACIKRLEIKYKQLINKSTIS